MPFKVIKFKNYYRIFKINTNTVARPKFKTKQAAENQMKNWLRYAHQRFKKTNKKTNRKTKKKTKKINKISKKRLYLI